MTQHLNDSIERTLHILQVAALRSADCHATSRNAAGAGHAGVETTYEVLRLSRHVRANSTMVDVAMRCLT